MEILHFIYDSFWHFIGTLSLIYTISCGVVRVVKAFCPDYRPIIYVCPRCTNKEEINDGTDT